VRDNDKALELARLWTATYPREVPAFNALRAIRYGQLRRPRGPPASTPVRAGTNLAAY
jgi:hypothetical protein